MLKLEENSPDLKKSFPFVTERIFNWIEREPKYKKLLPLALKVLKETKRYVNRVKRRIPSPFRHYINRNTVLAGAKKDWDPIRLLTRKHFSFSEIGALHLQLQSTKGDLIDATYLSCEAFLKFLEAKGAEKVVFQPNITEKEINPFGAQDVELFLSSRGEEKVSALKIPFEVLLQGITFEKIVDFYTCLKFKVYQGEKGDVFVISIKTSEALQKAGILKEGEIQDIVVKDKSSSQKGLICLDKVNQKFSGFHFKEYDESLARLFTKLDIMKSPWIYTKVGDVSYLIKRCHLNLIRLCHTLDHTMSSHLIQLPTLPVTTKKGPTVLLSMNQIDIYEQFASEFITFLLEGLNVIAYNNGGKGLSIGKADRKSIESAIKVTYEYLRQIEKVPEKKIVLKGQCFGGAPTAWLAGQYPETTLILDQCPANFYEVAIKKLQELIQSRKNLSSGSLINKVFTFLGSSTWAVEFMTRIMILNFDITKEIQTHKGHILLHVNVPNKNGTGGDKLVPEHHPHLLINSFPLEPNKKRSISFNPGGNHVTHWFSTSDSYLKTPDFLEETSLKCNIFQPDSFSDKAKEVISDWMHVFEQLSQSSSPDDAINLVGYISGATQFLSECCRSFLRDEISSFVVVDPIQKSIQQIKKLLEEINPTSLQLLKKNHRSNVKKYFIKNPLFKNLTEKSGSLFFLSLSNSTKCLHFENSFFLTDEGISNLVGLPLAEVQLKNCSQLTDKTCEFLSEMPLKSLTMIRCKITDNGLYHLRHLELSDLNLSGCERITDQGIAHLEKMQLKNLCLNGCKKITDRGLISLHDMPLEMLRLAGCSHITDIGLSYVLKMPLNTLVLSKCLKITDKGVKKISDMKLLRLELKQCHQITDTSLKLLKKMRLRQLDVRGCCEITREGIKGIRRKGLRILWFLTRE